MHEKFGEKQTVEEFSIKTRHCDCEFYKMTIFLQLLDSKNFQSKVVFYGKIWFGWNVFLDGEKKKKNLSIHTFKLYWCLSGDSFVKQNVCAVKHHQREASAIQPAATTAPHRMVRQSRAA